MSVSYETCPYLCTPDTLKQTLESHGVAIIANIITPEECESFRNGFWDYLEAVTSNTSMPIVPTKTGLSGDKPETKSSEIFRDRESTWRNVEHLYPKSNMLLQHFGIGHAKFVWDLRQTPSVYGAFAKLWGVPAEELLSSFDGASIHLPPEKMGYGRGWHKEGSSGFHCDQSFKRNGFECVQSFVCGNDVREGDATLRVLTGSHLLHQTFAHTWDGDGNLLQEGEAQDTPKAHTSKNWCKLTPEQIDWYKQQGCKDVAIACKAGSMVFWDSRTIHFGQRAHSDRAAENTRYVAYMCFTPRSFGTERNLAKKRKAYEEQRTTSHWPHKQTLFPILPRTFGNITLNANKLPLVELTELGKKFCGY